MARSSGIFASISKNLLQVFSLKVVIHTFKVQRDTERQTERHRERDTERERHKDETYIYIKIFILRN